MDKKLLLLSLSLAGYVFALTALMFFTPNQPFSTLGLTLGVFFQFAANVVKD